MSPSRYSVDRLVGFATAILKAVDVSDDDALTCATRLVEGDARGQRAHGLSRLPAYVRRIQAGGLDPHGRPRIVKGSAGTALIDGDNALGPVVMTHAVSVAAEKARAAGVSWTGVFGSNHAGANGVYAQLLVDQGLIGLIAAVANVNQMAPWGGIDRLLGPNPLAIGIPAGEEPPVVLDMATSAVAFGTVRQAVAAGKAMPVGWLIDDRGEPVTDPAKAGEGTLAPIGGYKGYGLSLAIAALAGTLNGAAAGSEVVDHYQDLETPTNTGHFVIALDPANFGAPDEFERGMDARIREIRDSRPRPGGEGIHVPGDKAAERRRRAAAEGIEVSDAVATELDELAQSVGSGARLLDQGEVPRG